MIVNTLRDIIKDKKISLRRFSKLAGLTYKTTLKLYHDDVTSIRFDTLDKICTSLDVSPGDILKHVSEPHVCSDETLETIKTIYERDLDGSYESLGYYECTICRRIWKIRRQHDRGTGCDDIWLAPGTSSRGYEFTENELKSLRSRRQEASQA